MPETTTAAYLGLISFLNESMWWRAHGSELSFPLDLMVQQRHPGGVELSRWLNRTLATLARMNCACVCWPWCEGFRSLG